MNRECLASRSVILCMSDPTAIILLFRYDNRESRLIPSNVCKQQVCTVEATSFAAYVNGLNGYTIWEFLAGFPLKTVQLTCLYKMINYRGICECANITQIFQVTVRYLTQYTAHDLSTSCFGQSGRPMYHIG